ncbi:MAG: DUF559 domain-containing protein [Promethearchaeota archaeon]
MNYCVDCGKKLSKNIYKRCNKCSKIKENNPNYKDGRTLKKYYCPICNKKLSGYQSIKCRSCASKLQERIANGRNYPNCIDCGKKLTHYKSNRCHSCENKKRWRNKNYRNKTLKVMFDKFNITPNKKEIYLTKSLNYLFPNEYKFVGDGQFIIGGFNPDFININGQKKIIELFGDYWHNRPGAKERDKLRLKTYKKYGYKTLIIWEKELKKEPLLIEKLRRYHNVA